MTHVDRLHNLHGEADFRCGILSDIQYADVDDAHGSTGTQWRRYRGTLEVARRAVAFFNDEHAKVFQFRVPSAIRSNSFFLSDPTASLNASPSVACVILQFLLTPALLAT